LLIFCCSATLTQYICNFDFLFEENITGLEEKFGFLFHYCIWFLFAYKIWGKNGSQGMFIVAAESHNRTMQLLNKQIPCTLNTFAKWASYPTSTGFDLVLYHWDGALIPTADALISGGYHHRYHL
jgi:hypothetical protein